MQNPGYTWNDCHYVYGVMLPDDSRNIEMSDVVIEIPNASWDHSVLGIYGGYTGHTLSNIKINIQNGYTGAGIVGVFSMKNSEINMKQGIPAINGGTGISIANNMINGSIVGTGLKCFGNYNSDFQPVVCP